MLTSGVTFLNVLGWGWSGFMLNVTYGPPDGVPLLYSNVYDSPAPPQAPPGTAVRPYESCQDSRQHASCVQRAWAGRALTASVRLRVDPAERMAHAPVTRLLLPHRWHLLCLAGEDQLGAAGVAGELAQRGGRRGLHQPQRP